MFSSWFQLSSSATFGSMMLLNSYSFAVLCSCTSSQIFITTSLCRWSGCLSGSVWCRPIPSWTMKSCGHPTPSWHEESWSATCLTYRWSAAWATASYSWWRAPCTPSKAEASPRPSTKPNQSASPCTPPASCGWPSCPSSSAPRSPQKRWELSG